MKSQPPYTITPDNPAHIMWTVPMQPIKELTRLLERLAGEEHYLFSLDDMRSAMPEASSGAFKDLISRAEKSELLKRVCRRIYLYPRVDLPPRQEFSVIALSSRQLTVNRSRNKNAWLYSSAAFSPLTR